jgi:hypothetical protein
VVTADDAARAAALAASDQVMALAEDLLTNMVADVRDVLASGVEPAAVVAIVAREITGVEPTRVASALAVALLRLARQGGTR